MTKPGPLLDSPAAGVLNSYGELGRDDLPRIAARRGPFALEVQVDRPGD